MGDVGSLTTHPISDTVIENHFQAKISWWKWAPENFAQPLYRYAKSHLFMGILAKLCTVHTKRWKFLFNHKATTEVKKCNKRRKWYQ